MKRLVIALAAAGALLGGIVAVNAQTPAPTFHGTRVYQSGAHETTYTIPDSGSYCFNASPDLALDLPVCGVNPHEAVAPDPNAAPVAIPAKP